MALSFEISEPVILNSIATIHFENVKRLTRRESIPPPQYWLGWFPEKQSHVEVVKELTMHCDIIFRETTC